MSQQAVTVDGIEPDLEMAAIARTDYRTVYPTGVEQFLAHRSVFDRYGTVLFLDVLEHLVDPAAVLAKVSRDVVSPGGLALISLPNVAHWTVRKELLLGRWEYQKSGLLDATHLRFFTLRSARELIEVNGWHVIWEGADVDQPPLIRLPPRALRGLARWPDCFGVQLLFVASAVPQPSTSR